jgi:hypothetical protein
VITDRIRTGLEHDFAGDALAQATVLIERIPAELAVWNIVTETDRVEAAALTVAGGDLERLRRAVDLALRDWRDLLVSAGDA